MPSRKSSLAATKPAVETNVAAILVAQGKILDYIDGQTQREDTPEEYVRQEIAKSLVREYCFPKDHVAVEFPLALGSKKPRVDLVIFGASQAHKQENARLIVECKASTVKPNDKKEGFGQLHSYMTACPNVSHGVWTNGLERLCYRKIVREGDTLFEEIPDIPGFGKSEEDSDRPNFDTLKPASSDALLFAFRRCHNYIAGNQGIQKQAAFWELLKLIFCKIHDERHSDEVEFYASAKDRHTPKGQQRVRDRIEALFGVVKNDYSSIFQGNDTIQLEPRVLTYLVTQLQMYSLLESDIDVKGRAYEEIVGSNLRGDRGEFFTPRNICRMAVEMLDPEEKLLILDPACGTGGFLITAMNHVIAKVQTIEDAKWKNPERANQAMRERIQKYAHQYVVGIDFNPELVKAAKMNMVMNNDGAGGLYQANSLLKPAEWSEELRERNLIGGVDLIVTNPPFGSKIPVDDLAFLNSSTSPMPGPTIARPISGRKVKRCKSPSLRKSYSLSAACSF
jgi:type I restriction enzyme M protein